MLKIKCLLCWLCTKKLPEIMCFCIRDYLMKVQYMLQLILLKKQRIYINIKTERICGLQHTQAQYRP
jgi:hypothetical protein